jgi:hypothetical protein
MSEAIIAKEARLKGLALFDVLRSVNIDGSIAGKGEWPPRTIVKSLQNTGSMAERILAQAASSGRPVQAVGFWGVGDKREMDMYDTEFLRQLQTLSQAVEGVHAPGLEPVILLADVHARFNGYGHADEYLSQISAQARDMGIASRPLSELYGQWGLPDPAAFYETDLDSPAFGEWNGAKYARQREQLIESAGRHSRAGVGPEQSAFAYFRMRHQEKEPLAYGFPDAFLFANTSPDLGGWLLPKQSMPVMYMQAKPPWFRGSY